MFKNLVMAAIDHHRNLQRSFDEEKKGEFEKTEDVEKVSLFFKAPI